jgi:hypothetical protein
MTVIAKLMHKVEREKPYRAILCDGAVAAAKWAFSLKGSIAASRPARTTN